MGVFYLKLQTPRKTNVETNPTNICQIVCDKYDKKVPANRIRTSDLRMASAVNPLQSSALPTELSRDELIALPER